MAEKTNYSISGNKLLLPDGSVVFDKPINKVEPFGKLLLVHFDRKPGAKGGPEVCGVDPKSHFVLWKLSGKQRISGKKLLLERGVVEEFEDHISQAETFGKVLVVLFEKKSKPKGSSEVCGVSAKSGKVLWRRTRKKEDDPFLELCPHSKTIVRVFSWRGDVLDLDVASGTLIGKYWTK